MCAEEREKEIRVSQLCVGDLSWCVGGWDRNRVRRKSVILCACIVRTVWTLHDTFQHTSSHDTCRIKNLMDFTLYTCFPETRQPSACVTNPLCQNKTVLECRKRPRGSGCTVNGGTWLQTDPSFNLGLCTSYDNHYSNINHNKMFVLQLPWRCKWKPKVVTRICLQIFTSWTVMRQRAQGAMKQITAGTQ